MKNKFKPNQNEQLFLLPPSVEDFIPESHLARLIHEVVENFDTSFIEGKYSALGQKSYHPKSLIKIWIYGYATGIFSGRKIAAKCESDTAYMFLAGMYKPDFRTINDFRKDNLEAFSKYFIHVLSICRKLNMGHLGTIAIDGTKIRANASVKKTKDKEHFRQWLERTKDELSELHKKADAVNAEEEKQLGETRGDELPKEIRTKELLKEKIQQVMEQMEEEEKINLTDRDAKLMKSKGTVDCHYNCQGAASMDGMIVSAYVSTAANDREQLTKSYNRQSKQVRVK